MALIKEDVMVWDALDEIQQAEVVDTLAWADRNRFLLGNFELADPPLHDALVQAVARMATNYIRTDRYTPLKKLFKNTVRYVAEGRVERNEAGFFVEGLTDDHQVTMKKDGTMACDCPLFIGKAGTKFDGRADSECSHVQASELQILLDAIAVPDVNPN
jgi:hypothetical protein